MKKQTRLQSRRKYVKTGLKLAQQKRKLKKFQSKEDKFWDENDTRIVEDAMVMNPTRHDIVDEIGSLESFRDYAREARGNNLSYGDY
jgi:hypothetical protein